MCETFSPLMWRIRADALRMPPAAFANARRHRPPLEPFESIRLVLDALEPKSKTPCDPDAVVGAMVLEHRRTKVSEWASALLATFFPALYHLRRRIRSFLASSEVDQVVVTAFLNAASKLSDEQIQDRILMRLCQETKRRVFRYMKQDLRYHEERADKAFPLAESHSTECASLAAAEIGLDLLNYFRTATRRGASAQGLELLVRTEVWGESLVESMSRTPHPESEWELWYGRLREQKAQAVANLHHTARYFEAKERFALRQLP